MFGRYVGMLVCSKLSTYVHFELIGTFRYIEITIYTFRLNTYFK